MLFIVNRPETLFFLARLYQPVKSSTPAAGVDLALIDGQSRSAISERRMWQAVAAMTVIAITGEERLWRLSGRR